MTELSHKVFRPKSLAERWDCSERHIYNMIDRGELQAFRAGGRLIRITGAEVERWESGGATIESDSTDFDNSMDKQSSSGTRTESAEDAALERLRSCELAQP